MTALVSLLFIAMIIKLQIFLTLLANMALKDLSLNLSFCAMFAL